MSMLTPIAPLTKRTSWWMSALVAVILLASGIWWYQAVYLDPERVFWQMLATSLSTSGVSVETTQTSEQGAIKQVVQYELGAVNQAHSVTTLSQGATKVRTEIIGTPRADYTRYLSIDTDQKNAAGQPIDVSKVVGVWTKSDDTPQTATQSSGHQLLAQAALGIGLPLGSVPVPLGPLPAEARDRLLDQMKSQGMYQVSFDDVAKRRVAGRLQYVYKVKIPPILYVRFMKSFAARLGLHELDKVNPADYQSGDPLQVQLVVDATARQLVAVEHGGSFKQTYTGYGVPVRVGVPAKTISTTELQQRLSAL